MKTLFFYDENDIENSFINITDNEVNSISYCKMPYNKDTNINNNLYALPTKDTLNVKKNNEKEKDKDRDENKMNENKANENYNYPKEKYKIETPKKGLLGRKKKTDSGRGEHSKFSEDNLSRKCKHLILESSFNFINDKIKDKYNGEIGRGRFIRQLLILNQKQKSDASVQFNKEFLEKTLGDIFSENISSRYIIHHPCHNKLLIKILTSEEDEYKQNYKIC